MNNLRMFRAGVLMDSPATSDLSNSVAQSASAGMLVQSYCTQVAQQPMVVIPDSVKTKLPAINAYLKKAQDNASDYLTNIQPKIILVVTDVGGYATEFTNFFTLVSGRINDWKGGSTTAKQDALALLSQLQTDLGKRLTNVNDVRTRILGFQTKVDGDSATSTLHPARRTS